MRARGYVEGQGWASAGGLASIATKDEVGELDWAKVGKYCCQSSLGQAAGAHKVIRVGG